MKILVLNVGWSVWDCGSRKVWLLIAIKQLNCNASWLHQYFHLRKILVAISIVSLTKSHAHFKQLTQALELGHIFQVGSWPHSFPQSENAWNIWLSNVSKLFL